MKTFGKIVVCIIVVVSAIGVAYLAYNGGEKETGNNALKNTNTTTSTNNNNTESKIVNEIDENKDYIGEEENKEEPKEDGEPEQAPIQKPEEEQKTEELTGKDKAIDIVKKQYALDGQTVRFDHMEGTDYIIKINDGTAVTWYLVNGTTWEAEEY